MDMITLAMAKNYTDSQRLAYEEIVSIEWDGNTDGKAVYDTTGGGTQLAYRVSEKILSPGVYYEMTRSNGEKKTFTLYEMEPGLFMDDRGFVMSVHFTGVDSFGDHVEKGTYFYDGSNGKYPYVTSVKQETIHTIDPKFIPAMDDITLNGADGKQYKVTVNASGALTATAV